MEDKSLQPVQEPGSLITPGNTLSTAEGTAVDPLSPTPNPEQPAASADTPAPRAPEQPQEANPQPVGVTPDEEKKLNPDPKVRTGQQADELAQKLEEAREKIRQAA